MHPLRERLCDDLLENPVLASPPPEPIKPRPPRERRPRQFKIPPKFVLLTEDFYEKWVNHLKQLQMMRHIVDDKPPELFPDMYLKPRRLNYYAQQLEHNMTVNKDLLKKINIIQRTGGFVDCWQRPEASDTYNKLMVKKRQLDLDVIQDQNRYFYGRLLIAQSEQPTTKEFDAMWADTKQKLILGASLPFILFKTEKIDRGVHDPNFDKPSHIYRTKVSMDIRVRGGSKIGKVTIELFSDLVPRTCQMFMSLVKGDKRGYAYTGCRIFRVVPDLYCRGGDVEKDNGYGMFLPDGETQPTTPENFELKHSVPGSVYFLFPYKTPVSEEGGQEHELLGLFIPESLAGFLSTLDQGTHRYTLVITPRGVLSMVVTPGNEVTGQFNIIFKPLPQLDGKHVVFGRIVGGPTQTLERISALGLPLGTTTSECAITACGLFTRKGVYRAGAPNTRPFPPRKKNLRS